MIKSLGQITHHKLIVCNAWHNRDEFWAGPWCLFLLPAIIIRLQSCLGRGADLVRYGKRARQAPPGLGSASGEASGAFRETWFPMLTARMGGAVSIGFCELLD